MQGFLLYDTFPSFAKGYYSFLQSSGSMLCELLPSCLPPPSFPSPFPFIVSVFVRAPSCVFAYVRAQAHAHMGVCTIVHTWKPEDNVGQTGGF